MDLTTRAGTGGNLSSPFRQDGLYGITMSDSGLPGWATFEKGRALVPLHLLDANPHPVTLDISGSIGRFNLTVPTFADITIHGTQPYIPEEDLLKPVVDHGQDPLAVSQMGSAGEHHAEVALPIEAVGRQRGGLREGLHGVDAL